MLYRHTAKHCFGFEGGADEARVDALLAQLSPCARELIANEYKTAAPLLDIASRTDDLPAIEAMAKRIRSRFRHIVIAGAGGSGLSGRMLLCLQPTLIQRTFHFLDNIDPDTMQSCLDTIDIKETFFIIISKSGTTVETLSQFYVLLGHAEKILGKAAIAEHFAVITTPGDNPMRHAASQYTIPVIDHEPDIGGRFSMLTSVGLLPAAIAGLNIKALRDGAASVISQFKQAASLKDFPPALGAALQYALMEQGYRISVMLPYSERLTGFSAWYRQSWAESLGKGGKGTTPIRAVGTTDQHSQLQLYLDGPRDKLFHLIMLKRAGTGEEINVPALPELDYMRGKTMGDIMAAEQKATLETLVRNGRPVRLFEIDTLAEEQMGALVMHFIFEIIFMSRLLGVNPFNQPAVEEGKKLARDYLLTGNL